MSYTALYRKFRPGIFEDVKGQEHIVKTLKNQIGANRIGHAYLFCGTRGTGKTTVAKIFAKAVNCEQPKDGSPCEECAACKEISSGASMNVIEIDAASNNGVDNIREIREEVAYRPTGMRYKVYIIDEVHMLSMGAFNALLKTLEEPPEYVIFILATTEMHKIPITILSRCQRYEFKRITIDTIARRLEELMKEEQIEAEEKAIRYIAKSADGSMRDALSLLDQCIAFYLGETLTYDKTLNVLGAVDTEVFGQLLRAVIESKVEKVIEMIDTLIIEGRDLTQLAVDFTWYLRNLLLIKSSDNMEEILDVSTESLVVLKEEAEMIPAEILLRYIRIFSDMSAQLKNSTQKRVLMEVTFIKLCKPEMETKTDTILDRLRELENKIEKVSLESEKEKIVYVNADAQPKPKKEPKKVVPKALSEDVKMAAREFRGIVDATSMPLRAYLKKAIVSVGERGQLLVVLSDELGAEAVGQEAHLEELKGLIEEKIGKSMEIDIRHEEEEAGFEGGFPNLEELIKLEIEVEEDM